MSESVEMETVELSLFQKCKDQLSKRVKDIGLTPGTLVLIVRYAMEIVELTQLKGRDQKDMAIKLVLHLVVESNLEESAKNLCIKMLKEGVVERTIDLIIDATKGRIAVNGGEILEVAQTCCSIFSAKK